jgi:nucleotide-binding universal stress UspA family protein
MKHFLVIADRPSGAQRIIGRAVELARGVGAKLTVVGFVYEHIGSLPVALSPGDRAKLQKKLIERHVPRFGRRWPA